MEGMTMSSEDEYGAHETPQTLAAFGEAIAGLPNEDLLTALDLVLLELERRLLRYARIGPDLLDMADEGLVLAVRAGARLRQAESSAAHATGHLQVVGVGGWTPRSTTPSWNQDPRVAGDE
jgi:hypothetical protein